MSAPSSDFTPLGLELAQEDSGPLLLSRKRERRAVMHSGLGLAADSTGAFAQLVDAHYGALYRFGFSLARNASDAGDLVQQTFFIWATKGSSLKDEGAAKGWLFTTLYREFLRLHRRGARSSSFEALPDSPPEFAADEVDRVALCD